MDAQHTLSCHCEECVSTTSQSYDILPRPLGEGWGEGFTLAEVLITLGIIGVVAALTIPTLMQKTDDRENISRLKKFYSVAENAFKLAEVENGTVDKWGLNRSLYSSQYNNPDTSPEAKAASDAGVNKFWSILLPYFNNAKIVGNGKGDLANYLLDGRENDTIGKIVEFSDGSVVRSTFITENVSCIEGSRQNDNMCGDFFLDVNGDKKPNTLGKDIFAFKILKDGIIPYGTKGSSNRSFETSCNMTSSNEANGFGCTAWVLLNDNMDYLYCNDLDWETKTKCN